jgi:hypothetical protein
MWLAKYKAKTGKILILQFSGGSILFGEGAYLPEKVMNSQKVRFHELA